MYDDDTCAPAVDAVSRHLYAARKAFGAKADKKAATEMRAAANEPKSATLFGARPDQTAKVTNLISAVSAVAIALLCEPAHATAVCNTASNIGDLCTCKVLQLHPTQFAVGMIEIGKFEGKLKSKSGAALRHYQEKHPEPVVMGTGGVLYITDHHHLARAMVERGIETTSCQIEADYSGLDLKSFWAKMADRHWVYLYDENGKGPRDPADLPRSVQGLKDDPYRSLAGAVRHNGGYAKVTTLFADFAWANYYRASGISTAEIQTNFQQAVDAASVIAMKREACSLPGYEGPSACK